ncbi:lipase family protein [Nonomuraea guangzhouensis]|uniref:Lipase family protein n=1 Tax=Nonomuraea guangzhouensis TaxID=1291555 RepID=A0ABW4GH63_9ACTN|nr:lipase family protein [Nonomuraea guangzhouensis]
MTFSRAIVTAGLTLGCLATTFPAEASVAQTVARGGVVSSTLVEKLDRGQVAERIKATGIDAAQVKYGVSAYRVVYRTVDAKGRSTTASQLVALPDNTRRNLRVVSWLHGTTVYRGDVASVNEKSTDRAAALLFAGAGHAVSAPDYLGLGTGPGYHTYGDPRTTVSAPVDALRATRAFTRGRARLDSRVLVSGFSQGGPATMMVGRFLQQGQDPYFRLGGLASIAGPFDLSSFEAAAADDKIRMASLYLAYFVISADRYTDIYRTPSEAFRAPYDEQVEKLFDGNHQAAEIAKALPPTSEKLFTAQFLDRIRKPTGKLKELLTALGSTCNWKPAVPVRLHHAKGDTDVAYDNALYCQRQLRSHGATQTLTDAGNVDHNQSVRKVLPLVVAGFTGNRA